MVTLSMDHVVPVNRIYAVKSCLEIDMGKSSETVFGWTFESNFQVQSVHYNTNSTDREKIIKACDALITSKPNLNVNYIAKMQFIMQSCSSTPYFQLHVTLLVILQLLRGDPLTL